MFTIKFQTNSFECFENKTLGSRAERLQSRKTRVEPSVKSRRIRAKASGYMESRILSPVLRLNVNMSKNHKSACVD